MTKPTEYPDWYPTGPDANTIEPSTGKKNAGFAALERIAYQYINWLLYIVSQWIRYFDTAVGGSGWDIVVGAESYCTHADIPTAVADSGTGTNLRVLVVDSVAAVNATINFTKAGWKVYFKPGVTYTKGTAATCFSCQATGIEIRNARFSGFTTAITGTSGWTYGRVVDCNFATCTTTIDDSSVPAGKKPVDLANITE